ncbi:hypothetical protein U0070_018702 [Myodes glareolus]|uniref:Uncharacterized protein n=1 Tax=Myodes glareolus TaxID=447135 RepID=A0AAW0IVX0_MYOGA
MAHNNWKSDNWNRTNRLCDCKVIQKKGLEHTHQGSNPIKLPHFVWLPPQTASWHEMLLDALQNLDNILVNLALTWNAGLDRTLETEVTGIQHHCSSEVDNTILLLRTRSSRLLWKSIPLDYFATALDPLEQWSLNTDFKKTPRMDSLRADSTDPLRREADKNLASDDKLYACQASMGKKKRKEKRRRKKETPEGIVGCKGWWRKKCSLQSPSQDLTVNRRVILLRLFSKPQLWPVLPNFFEALDQAGLQPTEISLLLFLNCWDYRFKGEAPGAVAQNLMHHAYLYTTTPYRDVNGLNLCNCNTSLLILAALGASVCHAVYGLDSGTPPSPSPHQNSSQEGQEVGVGSSTPVRIRTSSLLFTKGQGQLSQGQRRVELAQHGPLISSSMVPMAPTGNTGHGHQHRPQLQQARDPDMVLRSSLGSEDTLALGGSTGHSNQHGPRSMALGHQHGPSGGAYESPVHSSENMRVKTVTVCQQLEEVHATTVNTFKHKMEEIFNSTNNGILEVKDCNRDYDVRCLCCLQGADEASVQVVVLLLDCTLKIRRHSHSLVDHGVAIPLPASALEIQAGCIPTGVFTQPEVQLSQARGSLHLQIEQKSLENPIDKGQKSSQALSCLSQPCGKAALTIDGSFYGPGRSRKVSIQTDWIPKNPEYAEETSPRVIVNGFLERLRIYSLLPNQFTSRSSSHQCGTPPVPSDKKVEHLLVLPSPKGRDRGSEKFGHLTTFISSVESKALLASAPDEGLYTAKMVLSSPHEFAKTASLALGHAPIVQFSLLLLKSRSPGRSPIYKRKAEIPTGSFNRLLFIRNAWHFGKSRVKLIDNVLLTKPEALRWGPRMQGEGRKDSIRVYTDITILHYDTSTPQDRPRSSGDEDLTHGYKLSDGL